MLLWVFEMFCYVIMTSLITLCLLSVCLWSDIDGLGSSAIGGQLIRKANTQSPFSCDKSGSDTLMAGTDTPQVLTPPGTPSCPF